MEQHTHTPQVSGRRIRSMRLIVLIMLALAAALWLAKGGHEARERVSVADPAAHSVPPIVGVDPSPAATPERRSSRVEKEEAAVPTPGADVVTDTKDPVPSIPAANGVLSAPATSPPDLIASVDVTEFPTGEPVIPASDGPADPQGRVERVHLVRRDGKYPLVRVVDVLGADGRVVRRREMVGDHVMVSMKAGTAPADVEQLARRHGCQVRRRIGASNVYLVSFPVTAHGDLPTAIAAISVEGVVSSKAEVDWIVHTTGGTPNDTSLASLWAMNNTGQSGGTMDADIDALEAWDITTGSTAVKVGVIDTGIDYNHPDLAANCWVNPGESGLDANGNDKRTNGIDDDGNGYIDDWHGWDFYNNDNNPFDDNYHGTHVAGTIGGVGDNGVGVTGVCWNVSLIGIKSFSSTNSGPTSDQIEAIAYCTLIGCDLTSNSWGGGEFSQALKDVIDQANAAGVLFVAAAGNTHLNNDVVTDYPSGYSSANIIAVTATTRSDSLASFSNWGPTSVDIGAPGLDIYSTKPNNTYGQFSGTSMATPHIAGACALLKSLKPQLTAMEIRNILIATVDPVASLAGKCVSGGRLNVHRALLSIAGPHPQVAKSSQTIVEIGNGNGTLNPGEAADITVALTGVGNVLTTNVVGTLTTSDGAAMIEHGVVTYGSLNPGQTASGDGSFRVRLAVGTPTPRIVAMSLTITSPGGGPWICPITATFLTNATISGRVLALTGGAPIVGATVTLGGAATASTISDGVGRYNFAVLDGKYTVKASASGHVPNQPILVTCPPDRLNVDIILGTPRLVVTPASLAMTVESGATANASLLLQNQGDVPLTFTMAPGVSGTWVATGMWHESSLRAAEGTTSWYYGLESSHSYYTGAVHSGTLTLPAMILPSVSPVLSFREWRAAGSGDSTKVQISSNGGSSWTTIKTSSNTSGNWVSASISLSAYAGNNVKLRFNFTSDPFLLNDYEGWYVDDVKLNGQALDNWLTATPTSGVIAAGSSTTVTCQAVPGRLPAGNRSAALVVQSNDPIEPTITVPVDLTVVAAPVLTVQVQMVDDDATVPSSGDGDGFIEPNETIAIVVQVTNTGSVPATGVTALLTTVSSQVTIVDGSITYGDIVADPMVGFDAPFIITIRPTASDGTIVPLTLVLRDGAGRTWSKSLSITVQQRSRIAGVVRSAVTGTPVSGAVVTIGTKYFLYPPETGEFAVDSLPPGVYSVAVSAAGYASSSQSVTLPPDASNLSIQLQPVDIEVTPTALAIAVEQGKSASAAVTIRNVGQGNLGWYLTPRPTFPPTPVGLWHVSTAKSVDGSSWYYGSDVTRNYETGTANTGTLTFWSAIKVPTLAPTLTGQQWRDCEGGTARDKCLIQISANGSLWTTVMQSTDVSGTWVPFSAALDAYAGQFVYIRFLFDTVDAVSNQHEGWYVDDVRLGGSPLEEFLTFSTSTGSVGAGAATTLTVTATPGIAAPGVYTRNVDIGSTDLDEPLTTVVVTTTVFAATTVTIVASDAFADEYNAQPGSFTVTRSGSTVAPLTVQVSIGGTASSSDYVPITVPVAIPSGQLSVVIPVTPVNDTLVESAETVIVSVLAGSGYQVGAPSSATVTIADNDVPSSTTVVLQNGLNGYVGTMDAYLSSSSPTNTGGGATPNLTATHNVVGDDTRTIMVKFPIFISEGGSVPNGATILSATLSLYQYSTVAHGFGAHRILKSWSETSSSWNNAATGTPWTVGGAKGLGTDIVPAADGTGATTAAAGWMSIDVTAGVIAFAGGTANNGWRLKGIGGTNASENFLSRESATVSKRPKLIIVYVVVPAASG